MAADDISVRISAKDQASATIDKMVADMAAQQKKLAKAFKDAGLEVEQFNKSVEKKPQAGSESLAARLGLGHLSRGFSEVSDKAEKAAAGVSHFIPALTALGAVATAAGIGKLVQDWTSAGARLDLTAQSMGISVDRLGQAQNAMRLAGGSAEDMTTSLGSLQTAMRDAIYRDPAKANLFRGLGIDVGNWEHGARRAIDILPQVADKVQQLTRAGKTDAALHLLDMLGISRSALNLLKEGSGGLSRYLAEAGKLGTITQEQADRARELQVAQERLKISFEQLGYTFAGEFGPDLVKILDRLTSWASDPKTRETISEIVRAMIHWVESADWNAVGKAFERIGTAINTIVTALGHMGDKGVVETLATVLGVDPNGWLMKGLRLLDTQVPTPPDLRGGRQTPYVDDQGRPIGVDVGLDNDADHTGRTRRSTPPPGISGWWHDHMPGWLGGDTPGPAAVPGDPNAPRGIRNNNPLNLSYVGQPGATGSDGRFAIFPTMEAGVGADLQQLLRYQQRGLMSVRQMITTWAPPSENDTNSYVAEVARRVGINPDAAVDLRNQGTAVAMIRAMARRETGRELDPAVAQAGVSAALGGDQTAAAFPPTPARIQVDVTHQNPPPGVNMRVSAFDPSSQVDINGPRTVRSMPGGWGP